MSVENLESEVNIPLTLGHIVVLWDFLQGKLAQVSTTNQLSLGQTRALWALEDICERTLIDNGFSSSPDMEWNKVIESAEIYAQSIPADYVD